MTYSQYRWRDVDMKTSRFDYTELEDGNILYERYFILQNGDREYHSDILPPDKIPAGTTIRTYKN